MEKEQQANEIFKPSLEHRGLLAKKQKEKKSKAIEQTTSLAPIYIDGPSKKDYTLNNAPEAGKCSRSTRIIRPIRRDSPAGPWARKAKRKGNPELRQLALSHSQFLTIKCPSITVSPVTLKKRARARGADRQVGARTLGKN